LIFYANYLKELYKTDTMEQNLEDKLVEKQAKKSIWLRIADLVKSKNSLDEQTLEDLEEALILADVGVETTQKLIDNLQDRCKAHKEKLSAGQMLGLLRTEILQILKNAEKPVTEAPQKIILVVGVNGVGKTTSIAKLAHFYKAQGKTVMLAAGDTFRAAATEQLNLWAERLAVPIVKQQMGADPASVAFDAATAFKNRQIDVLIIDTAGRLHNNSNLMQELSKIKRVLQKVDMTAPHEILLVVDGSTGQNALQQAMAFGKATEVTGLIVSKLDGTAKGGILLAIADELKIPVRFVGMGEKASDLALFEAEKFAMGLL